MNIETNTTKIKAAIKSINGRRATLVEAIQQTGLSVILHAHVHGDITLINSLCDAVGSGMKASALKLWLMDYAPVALADKAKRADGTFVYSKSKRVEGEELENTMAAAAAKPWHDYKTEKEVDEFVNVQSLLTALVKKLDKAKVKPEQAELAAAIKRLAAAE